MLHFIINKIKGQKGKKMTFSSNKSKKIMAKIVLLAVLTSSTFQEPHCPRDYVLYCFGYMYFHVGSAKNFITSTTVNSGQLNSFKSATKAKVNGDCQDAKKYKTAAIDQNRCVQALTNLNSALNSPDFNTPANAAAKTSKFNPAAQKVVNDMNAVLAGCTNDMTQSWMEVRNKVENGIHWPMKPIKATGTPADIQKLANCANAFKKLGGLVYTWRWKPTLDTTAYKKYTSEGLQAINGDCAAAMKGLNYTTKQECQNGINAVKFYVVQTQARSGYGSNKSAMEAWQEDLNKLEDVYGLAASVCVSSRVHLGSTH